MFVEQEATEKLLSASHSAKFTERGNWWGRAGGGLQNHVTESLWRVTAVRLGPATVRAGLPSRVHH